jgi:hypothetical protein
MFGIDRIYFMWWSFSINFTTNSSIFGMEKGSLVGTFWMRRCRLFYQTSGQFLHKFVVLSVYFKSTWGRLRLNSFLGRSNSARIVILVKITTKVEAHSSLRRNRNADHKVRGICETYEIPLYCLTCWKVVLSVLVCRVLPVVYIYNISWLEILLLNNGELYNA